MKRLILSFCTGLACFSLSAQSPVTYSNPVIPGDVADPTIIRAGDVYYAAGTSSEWAPFYPLFQSYDLVNWRQVGHLFDEQPAWTKSSFCSGHQSYSIIGERIMCIIRLVGNRMGFPISV